MKAINKEAQKTFETVLKHMSSEGHAKINNSESFMPLCVQKIMENDRFMTVALTHYYKQNGDLVSDPEMTFLYCKASKRAYPLTFEMGGRLHQQAVELGSDLSPVRYAPRMQKDLKNFANSWMKNIKSQQSL